MILWVEVGGEVDSLDCLVARLIYPSLSLMDFGKEGSLMLQQISQTLLLAHRTAYCMHSSVTRSYPETLHQVKLGSVH